MQEKTSILKQGLPYPLTSSRPRSTEQSGRSANWAQTCGDWFIISKASSLTSIATTLGLVLARFNMQLSNSLGRSLLMKPQ